VLSLSHLKMEILYHEQATLGKKCPLCSTAASVWRFCFPSIQLPTYLTNQPTNQPTPLSWVLIEKPPVVQLLKNFHNILWNVKVYHVHKSLPLVPILGQTNLVHATPPYFFKKHFIIILQPVSRSSKCSFLQAFSPRPCMHSSLVFYHTLETESSNFLMTA
jgi:hypothetical protein